MGLCKSTNHKGGHIMAETVPVNHNYHITFRSEHADRWLAAKSPRYHEYRRKWQENPQNYIDEGHPIHVDIEASSACNLKCPMCGRTAMAEKNPQFSRHFDFELYKRIVDEAVQIGVYSLKLNWRGEPLMNPHLVDMIKYAKQKGLEDVLMNTNAVLLDENMSRRIIEAGLDNLAFSFDSPYKETYEEIRIGASYEQVLANIRRFHEIREEMGAMSPLIHCHMVMMPGNEASFPDYVELFKDIADIIAFDDVIDRDAYTQVSNDTKFSCSQLWQRIMIASDGSIASCCADGEIQTGLGNIKDTTLQAVWNGPVHKELLRKHQEFQWHKMEICRTCPLVGYKKSGSV
jgi:radical SAM protein with 4Fe4S-binding SPASM domain